MKRVAIDDNYEEDFEPAHVYILSPMWTFLHVIEIKSYTCYRQKNNHRLNVDHKHDC